MTKNKIIVAVDRIFIDYTLEIKKTFQKYFSEVQLVNKYGIPLENKITIKAIKKLEKLGKIGEKTIEII
ncbi:MAG: hypothetical protein ACRDAT_01505, partial [Cetobacterium sp.]